MPTPPPPSNYLLCERRVGIVDCRLCEVVFFGQLRDAGRQLHNSLVFLSSIIERSLELFVTRNEALEKKEIEVRTSSWLQLRSQLTSPETQLAERDSLSGGKNKRKTKKIQKKI